MTSDVTLQTALGQQQNTQASSNALAEDFSQFLNLLTVQLQNQDPLSPMETNEFTNQLVAFTGVEQQINTNQKLDSLVALQISNAFSSSLDYVGMDASYVSSEFHYDGARPAEIKYALNGDAFEAKARVVDAAGDIIYEQDVETGAGSHDFVWDGTTDQGGQAPAGTYEIRIDALDFDGNAVDGSTVVTGNVRGVETQGGAIFLLIGDRAVSVGNVLNVSTPPQSTSSTSTDETSSDNTTDDQSTDDQSQDGGSA